MSISLCLRCVWVYLCLLVYMACVCVVGSNGDGGEVGMKHKHEERQLICFLGTLL